MRSTSGPPISRRRRRTSRTCRSPQIFTSVVVRANRDAMALGPLVREAIWRVDRDQPVWKIRTMDSLVDNALGSKRVLLGLVGAFATVAVLLAGVGIFGVMSFAVTQRTHEVGVRMALGARGGEVLRLIVGQGLRLTLVALVIGLVAAVGCDATHGESAVRRDAVGPGHVRDGPARARRSGGDRVLSSGASREPPRSADRRLRQRVGASPSRARQVGRLLTRFRSSLSLALSPPATRVSPSSLRHPVRRERASQPRPRDQPRRHQHRELSPADGTPPQLARRGRRARQRHQRHALGAGRRIRGRRSTVSRVGLRRARCGAA